MKILSVKSLLIPEIKVIRFARFSDHRGYFSESFRKSIVQSSEELSFLHNVNFLQTIESFSHPGVIRGFHFQWNPYMGKLVRTIHGHMVDLVLDIRKSSSTFGKIIAYSMPYDPKLNYNEWIWVPPGFAHGNYYILPSVIEYFCSGEYSPGCESGISPLAKDIDWSLTEPSLKEEFFKITQEALISEKDKNGYSLEDWLRDPRSEQFP